MKLMIYAPPFDRTVTKMVECLRDRYHGPDTVYLPSLEDVESCLRQPSYPNKLLVLMPKDRHELETLTALSHLMRDAKLILVLPENEFGRNPKVHLMRPRFVTHTDCEPLQLALVVDRLMAADSARSMKAIHCS